MNKFSFFKFYNNPKKEFKRILKDADPDNFKFKTGIKNLEKILRLFKTKKIFCNMPYFLDIYSSIEKNTQILISKSSLFEYFEYLYSMQANINLSKHFEKWNKKMVKIKDGQQIHLQNLKNEFNKYLYPVYQKAYEEIENKNKNILHIILDSRYDNFTEQIRLMSVILVSLDSENKKVIEFIKENLPKHKLEGYFKHLNKLSPNLPNETINNVKHKIYASLI